jgi:hemerythrin-like domain-containing protein
MVAHEMILADSLKTIHQIISRGIDVSIEHLPGFILDGFKDDRTRQGYLDYVRALASIINSHHLTEDEIAFPFFHDKLPGTHFEWLHEDHHLIAGFLDELKPIMQKLDGQDTSPVTLEDLHAVLLKISDRWYQHIDLEVAEFVDLVDALATEEEQQDLIRQFAQHGVKLSVPHPLTIAFILYNLPKAERAAFTINFPPEVLNHMVPHVWKEQWEPMTPFFLEI